ncbi:bifunctional adenosylcobinamide kinase/adenosylcobinamide-phosphate guanylyltransferase [Pseudoflavonifractor phocaeensis]|uniref:bifunctional adenosylcobinamide kinase/adenosylcobinamide-phosphate guanylyltransferase n=1 Tax=Pseudoflavonifractor phocaeensis TaxID=1870988 RepID=UPI00195D3E3F|nr:bifunctional adenosylcobinamide kinase/adenosylcobinamide-phosphate guanylyltransferase [Pseudoflavonifractor phocaeensis]MBM6869446.1 bifunctional adenosylcobinamide kinase/adenosylcobinamide-phosphate guanylyltransferase [Pseudoflavonifractor phocaeensis]MBM6937647.1 bifunctional adenosylcobinamide kinase/adenosylcobinamide-phosphate guanylyltransferase [Pseudoflavonifractor phocaeensis]
MTLVSGGAASGKSELAEGIAVGLGGRLVYLATMEVWDQEDRRRVERHRKLRAGKGFETVERPRDLAGAEVPAGSTVLLECLSNLTANECFGPDGFDGAEGRILEGVDRVRARTSHLVIVTNELFSDGLAYPEETGRYLSVLAGLNRALAGRADRVVEVVCGLPVVWKGEGL